MLISRPIFKKFKVLQNEYKMHYMNIDLLWYVADNIMSKKL